jgi:hypothetical protein
MPDEQRNPHHANALTADDLTLGRRIIRFNKHFGAFGPFIVVGGPSELDTNYGPTIKLKNVDTGETCDYFLSDLGVIPFHDDVWNDANFIVDQRNQHLLPTALEPYQEDLMFYRHDDVF